MMTIKHHFKMRNKIYKFLINDIFEFEYTTHSVKIAEREARLKFRNIKTILLMTIDNKGIE